MRGSRAPLQAVPAIVRAAWVALPGDLLGRLAVRLAGARVTRTVVVDGIGRVELAEDPRLAWWLDAVPRAPTAMTFGRVVVARRSLSDGLIRHEAEHVRQWTRLGPLFLPAYLGAGVVARLYGSDTYTGNPFERAASRAADLPTAIRAAAGYDIGS